MNNELILRFVNADRLGQTVRLPTAKCSIGAGENCTLRLAGKGIRPVHCFIMRGPGGTVVRRWSPDTRLNGRPFRDAELHAGDRLSLGPVELEIVEGAPASQSSSKVDQEQLELTAKQQELDDLRDQLRHTQEQIGAWEAERQTLTENLTAARQREERDGQRFEQQLKTFGQLQAEWHTERDDLLARCAHLQAEFDAALSRAETANLTRRAMTEAWSPEQNDSAQTELEIAKQELAENSAKLAREREELEADLARWKSETAVREAQLDRAAGEMQLRQSDLALEAEKLRHAREALEEERASLQQGHRVAHQRFDEQLAEAAAQQAALAAQIEVYRTREAELIGQCAELQSQATLLTSEREALQSEIAQLQAELADRQAAMQQSSSELAQQRGEFDADHLLWQEERHAFSLQLEQQQEHVATLRQELDELRSALDARLADEATASTTHVAEALSPAEVIIEPLDDVAEEPAPARPSHEREASPSGISEAMLALQRLREAALNGEDDEEDVPSSEPILEPVAEIAPARHADDSDTSIEDYMSQLMQRVRGKSETEAPQSKRKQAPAPQPKPAAPAIHTALPKQSDFLGERVKTDAACKPLETLRSLPARAAAPEQSRSLQAMRELANQSARSAIDTSAQGRWQGNVRGKFAVSIASFVCGGALLTFGNGLLSWTTAAALGSFAAAGLFGFVGYKLRKQGMPTGGEKQ